MRTWLRFALTVVVASAAACDAGSVTGSNASDRPVVIQAMLIGNQPLQTVTILWAPTPSIPLPTGGPAPADVRLCIVSPAGDSTPVVAANSNGTYTAALSAQPGATYRLTGTILDSLVSAQTTLPSLVRIDSPLNGDTAVVMGSASQARGTVHITTAGAFAFFQSAIIEFGQQREPSGTTLFTAPPLFNFNFTVQVTDSTTGYLFQISAIDANATTFYGSRVATSTVRGALGVFGSSVADSVLVVIPQ